jgi:hypothetical protein
VLGDDDGHDQWRPDDREGVMAVSTLDQLANAAQRGETKAFIKSAFTSEGAGTFHSLWAVAGNPAAGAAAGSINGVVPVDSTLGAFGFVNAAGTDNNYIGSMTASSTVAGTLVLYDRLWHSSGMSGTQTVSTAITPTALTRYTTGAGVEMWGEIYSAIGATGATLTVQYTDQDGNTAQSATYAHPANAETVGQMFPFVLASGDTGVRAPTNYQWSISTATAGNFGLTLMKRIVTLPLAILNKPESFDAISCAVREVVDDACLAFMVQCSTTAMGLISGELTLAKG